MTIGFIAISILCVLVNGYFIKRISDSRWWIYDTAAAILNTVFVAVTILKNNVSVSSYFDIFSINMLIYLSVCDIIDKQLPVIAFPIYAVVGVGAGIANGFVPVILFSAAVFGVLFLASKKSKGGVGLGDVYGISCVSLYSSVADTMGIIIGSLFISLIFGIVHSIIRKTGMKTMVPYMPFLLISFYLIKTVY